MLEFFFVQNHFESLTARFNEIKKMCQKALITTPFLKKVNKHCPLHHHKVSLQSRYTLPLQHHIYLYLPTPSHYMFD